MKKYIKNTKEIKELGNAYKFIFDKIENEGQVLLNNQFILSADEYVVKEWENWLGIPFDSSLTLEERRQQILLKINMKPPYTFNNMKKQIYAFTGVESEITEDRANLAITIDLTGASNGAKKLVKQYMDKIKPVNVVYNIINKQAILYNQYYGIAISPAQIYDMTMDLSNMEYKVMDYGVVNTYNIGKIAIASGGSFGIGGIYRTSDASTLRIRYDEPLKNYKNRGFTKLKLIFDIDYYKSNGYVEIVYIYQEDGWTNPIKTIIMAKSPETGDLSPMQNEKITEEIDLDLSSITDTSKLYIRVYGQSKTKAENIGLASIIFM